MSLPPLKSHITLLYAVRPVLDRETLHNAAQGLDWPGLSLPDATLPPLPGRIVQAILIALDGQALSVMVLDQAAPAALFRPHAQTSLDWPGAETELEGHRALVRIEAILPTDGSHQDRVAQARAVRAVAALIHKLHPCLGAQVQDSFLLSPIALAVEQGRHYGASMPFLDLAHFAKAMVAIDDGDPFPVVATAGLAPLVGGEAFVDASAFAEYPQPYVLETMVLFSRMVLLKGVFFDDEHSFGVSEAERVRITVRSAGEVTLWQLAIESPDPARLARFKR